ncbi:G-type lectin S-receptor-like serine/threonine-protein kinase LECRK2 [Magnolia sinica]|uniref:G-type lectin S-receptor-like serine/threonine-protein kinase LECRK2 n=1 Tax=Magnolia sinica TaxID=86752 RepID=UPI00265A2AC2|nr:G-type lectin S-receptor-like serine/threonine-protein kinase LECRK2 [Magnolia sinica]
MGSFNEPTDTISPTQVLNFGGKLSPRMTETNYSIGMFELRFLPDGNLVLNRLSLPTGNPYEGYYSINTNLSGYQMIFNQSGHIYILRRNQSIVNLTPTNLVLTEDFYYRAKVDMDGTSRHYCSLDNDGWGICQCPYGFSFFDQSNKFKGCKPYDVIQACKLDPLRRRDLFELREMGDTAFPGNNYEGMEPMSENECRDAYLDDCHCMNGRRKIKGGSSMFINFTLLAISLFVSSRYHKRLRKVQWNSNMLQSNLRSFTYRELEEATDGFKEELGRGAFGTVYKGTM